MWFRNFLERLKSIIFIEYVQPRPIRGPTSHAMEPMAKVPASRIAANADHNGDRNMAISSDSAHAESIVKQVVAKLRPNLESQIRSIADELREGGPDGDANRHDRNCDKAIRRFNEEFSRDRQTQIRAVQVIVAKRLGGVADIVASSVKKQLADYNGTLCNEVSAACSTATQRAALKPLIDSLIALFDRIRNEREFLATSFRRDADLALNATTRRLQDQHDSAHASYAQEILIMLRSIGVEILQAGNGPFNPQIQKVVGVEPTAHADRDGHVFKIVSPGFLLHQAVLRPETVIVFKKESKS